MSAAQKLPFTPESLPENENVGRAAARLDAASLAALLDDPAVQSDLALVADADAKGRGMAVARLIEAGLYELPDPGPEKPPRPGAGGSPLKLIREAADGPPPRPEPVMTCAADVVREDVIYLWPGRVVWDRITIFMGMPDHGKSHLMTWLTATVSSGGAWPEGTGNAEVGSVIVLQAEESRGADIFDRLEAFGADTSKVHYLDEVKEGAKRRLFSIGRDCGPGGVLEIALDRYEDVRLVYFDPLEAYVGERTMRSGEALYEALLPLKALAERRKFAAVIVAHPNKDGDQNIVHRMCGSQGLGAIARTLWYVSEDPNNPERRMISYAKGNPRGLNRKPLAFGLTDGRLVFDADCGDMRAKHVDWLIQRNFKQEAIRANRRGPEPVKGNAIRELILEALADGSELRADLKKRATERGFPVSTFGDALKSLRAEGKVRKVPVDGDRRHWFGLTPAPEPVSDGATEGPAPPGNSARPEEST